MRIDKKKEEICMEIKEALERLGVDYKILKQRFSNNEGLLKKFILKFPNDACYARLQTAVQAKDYKMVEMEAHTLKGVSANLGFEVLYLKCSELVQYLRDGHTDNVEELNKAIIEEYNKIIEGLTLVDH